MCVWRAALPLALVVAVPLLAAGCANPAIRVAVAGDRAAIAGASIALAERAATDPLVMQLARSGVATVVGGSPESGALQLQLTTISRSGKTGICGEPAARPGEPCGRWMVQPPRGMRLFGTPDVHQLALRFTDPATGRVPVQVTASTSRRKPADADLHRKLLDAAIACAGCAGGPLAKPAP